MVAWDEVMCPDGQSKAWLLVREGWKLLKLRVELGTSTFSDAV